MSATTGVPALREIPGPSAFGGGARRFFDLTWLLSVTEFKLNYFGTVFGYLWSLMRPLMLFAVLYVGVHEDHPLRRRGPQLRPAPAPQPDALLALLRSDDAGRPLGGEQRETSSARCSSRAW